MADKTSSARNSDSPRTTFILALVALAIGIYVIVFGLQTLFYFEARAWADSAPYLREVPQPLPSTVPAGAQDQQLSFYDMDFAAPWKGVASQKAGPMESVVTFRQGPILVFFNPANETDILANIRDGDPQVYHRDQDVFGGHLFPTNYDLYKAVYGASPASISPFMPHDKMLQISTLLQWKLAFAANGASAIYNVELENGMHGLQFGDPSRDRMIVVRLFDSTNHQYRLLFTSKEGPGTFPQTDINCVLGSLRPAPIPR